MSSATDAVAAAAAAAEQHVPALPPDAMAEILARVQPDVAFLFRCAVVCKKWCRLLTDPDFLRRVLPETESESGRSSLLLGFIAERQLPPRAAADPMEETAASPLIPAFVPAPGSALGPGQHRSLASFVRDDAGVLDRAEPLAAHEGLLLLRVVVSDSPDLRLCVCNLLTGRLDVLPPLNTASFDLNGVKGYGVVPAAADTSSNSIYSTSFHVLLIAVHHGENQLYLHRFSSSAAAAAGNGNWIATPTNFFPHDMSWRAPIPNTSFRKLWSAESFCLRQRHLISGCRAATVCSGAAHWLFEFEGDLYVHHLSLKTWKLGTTRVLIDVLINWCNARLRTSIDGKLSFVYVSDDNLVIWTQRDRDHPDYDFGWELKKVIMVNVKRCCSGQRPLATACFGEKSGTVFVIYDSRPDSAYLFDLRSRFVSHSNIKVTGWNDESLNAVTVVPYEVNWPRFFMSRLGTRM